MKSFNRRLIAVGFTLLAVAFVGLSSVSQPSAPANSLDVLIDGSSTVAPITQAVAEEFKSARPEINVSVGVSGTGGGFRRFCPDGSAPETDISDASRPISSSEQTRCSNLGVEYVELPVAFDGLTVAVDIDQAIWPAGAPVCLTRGELARMWDAANEGNITNWGQVRADLANQPITFSGAAESSGTRDFFIEALGFDSQREDGFFTEDDNLLAQQAGENPLAITYFGFAFFINNQDKVQAVAIDNRDDILANSADCNGVLPSFEAIEDFSYQPFSRPLFIYVNAASAERGAVDSFVDFYLTDANIGNAEFIADIGYVALNEDITALTRTCWDNRVTGTAFSGAEVGLTITEILDRKNC